MEKIVENWKEILREVEPEMMPASYNTWIKPLVPQSIDKENGIVKLVTYNDMSKSVLTNRYVMILEKAIYKVYGESMKIEFILSDEVNQPSDKSEIDKDKIYYERVLKRPGNDELYLNPRYNFSTFVVGANNELAHAAALAVARNPASVYNPLFLYGNSGLGKTHLMHAIGHYVMQNHPLKKVLYVSSEMFTNELVNAIQGKKMDEFRNKYRNIDVMLIDDIQFIEKKDRTQEELFHTFNTLYDTNKQIIFSSDRPPKEIETIDKRLQSRFEWGLPVDIQSPDFETRVAILKNKAEMEDIQVNDDMLEIFYLIADKITANIRELEGALNRVIAHANLMNKPLAKETAKEVLTDVFDTSNRQIDIPLIKNTVCAHFGINVQDMDSSKRTKNLAHPRQIAMYLSRELTNLSLPKIGENFGKRDHTTVMHAYDKITKEIAKDEEMKNLVNELKSNILDN
ncbi:MAG: chromosomal replication initiator protein DnaA [Firmicutes bacterium]|nr:chromosomal replication initiator protein DnaA [Bacillota bacterium]